MSKSIQEKVKKFRTRLHSMAYNRSDWIDRMRWALEGAVGEFAKQKYAELIGYKGHDWSDEVHTLLHGRVARIWRAPMKGNANKSKALAEAMLEVTDNVKPIMDARHTLLTHHPLTKEQRTALRNAPILDTEESLLDTLVRFYPDLLDAVDEWNT